MERQLETPAKLGKDAGQSQTGVHVRQSVDMAICAPSHFSHNVYMKEGRVGCCDGWIGGWVGERILRCSNVCAACLQGNVKARLCVAL